jgi:hypothetical protein
MQDESFGLMVLGDSAGLFSAPPGFQSLEVLVESALSWAGHDASVVVLKELAQVAADGRRQSAAADYLVAEGRRDPRRCGIGEPFEHLSQCLTAPPRRLGQGTRAAPGVGSARRLAVLVPFRGTAQGSDVVAGAFPANSSNMT